MLRKLGIYSIGYFNYFKQCLISFFDFMLYIYISFQSITTPLPLPKTEIYRISSERAYQTYCFYRRSIYEMLCMKIDEMLLNKEKMFG